MTFALVPGIEVLGQPEIPRAGVDEVLVQRAKDTWRGSKGQPGRGDEMFFNLALSLRRAGMDLYQIESTLRSARLLVMAHDEPDPMTKGSHQGRG